jgi:hypothetical protein
MPLGPPCWAAAQTCPATRASIPRRCAAKSSGQAASSKSMVLASVDSAPKDYKYNPAQTIDMVPAWQPAAPSPPTTPRLGRFIGARGSGGCKRAVWAAVLGLGKSTPALEQATLRFAIVGGFHPLFPRLACGLEEP